MSLKFDLHVPAIVLGDSIELYWLFRAFSQILIVYVILHPLNIKHFLALKEIHVFTF